MVCCVSLALFFGSAKPLHEISQADNEVSTQTPLVRGYLESKESPLAPETEFLLEHKHWKLLIAISAIESQFCKKQIDFNCWGIGGDSAYRHYPSIRAAIVDADALIEHWQKDHKRWLTVEDMNGSYVVPRNENWERVVNNVLNELESYGRPRTIYQQQRK